MQLFDLFAGKRLLMLIAPGIVALSCGWRPGIMSRQYAVIAQLQQQARQREGNLSGQTTQFHRQWYVAAD